MWMLLSSSPLSVSRSSLGSLVALVVARLVFRLVNRMFLIIASLPQIKYATHTCITHTHAHTHRYISRAVYLLFVHVVYFIDTRFYLPKATAQIMNENQAKIPPSGSLPFSLSPLSSYLLHLYLFATYANRVILLSR